ncbi:MAG TPA: helix-turn-helix domain-containing protein [Steroidobacteraceae bacterium]|jgi:hypothetical protein|nr:helix-turn-helix domain-containing protein [Steroidobacteraceae bacterium]
MSNRKAARGRPTKFFDQLIGIAARLAQEGRTDAQIATLLGISRRTLNGWKTKHPEFFALLKKGKAVADELVERCLFERATGYTFESEKVMQYEGAVVRARTVEHVPPDVTACIFWLKNRQPESWNDKSPPPSPIGPGLTVILQQAIGGGIEKITTPGRVIVALPPPQSRD